MLRVIPLLLASSVIVPPAVAQSAWLPKELEDLAATRLVDRMTELDVLPSPERDQNVAGAHRLVRDLAGRIEGWGLDGVLQRAPALSEVPFPDAGNPIVKGLMRYGVCSLPLHPELVETREEKLAIAVLEAWVGVVSMFLRDRFLKGGGTDKDLALALNSEKINQVSYDIQVDEKRRNYVMTECEPMFEALWSG